MKPKFVTDRGRVEIERNVLFIKTVKFSFWDSAFMACLRGFGPVIIFTILLLSADDARSYTRTVLWSVLAIGSLPDAYRILFKKSFANRIPLANIRSWSVRPDMNGLETHVVLELQSGRTRTITFRTLEKEFAAFTEFLSQHIATPQLA
jgi:hypothetical protein